MNTSIVPGQVNNYGIGDSSRVPVQPQLPSYPANFPIIQAVTPKGPIGQRYINVKDIPEIYGDIQNPDSPYYNPISVLVQFLADAGQASVGFRRLTANQVTARWIHGIKVTEGPVVQYKREPDGQFQVDITGNRVIDEDKDPVTGLTFEHVIMEANGEAYGKVKTVQVDDGTDNGKSTIYPIQEAQTGIGEAYNYSGLVAGIPASQDFDSIEKFVLEYGVFPYQMRLYEKSKAGTPAYLRTLTNSDTATYTLFDFKVTGSDVRYGIAQALGAYTGKNQNRPMVPRPAPFEDMMVYKDNIRLLARKMFAIESALQPDSLVYLEGVPYERQMNPLTCTNHKGVPYYGIALTGTTRLFNLNSPMDAVGGISPFLDNEGKPPVAVEGTYNFDPVQGQVDTLSTKDAWTITQSLLLADMMEYRQSLELKDWTRNRQSIIIDCGYNSDIKEEIISQLNVRKDHIAILQASVWLENNTVEERYSMRNSLATKLRLRPESERHGTPACRAAISLWDALVIDEESRLEFPCSLDLAHKFAQFGGAATGILRAENSPDHGDNRHLTKMHTPTVDLEDDLNAANNFSNGGITLRPYDGEGTLYRPALPTVYPYDDSVLKDLVSCFVGISCEKVFADTWPLVSGDTTITEEEYAATTKDRGEAAARQRFGSMFKDVLVETYYNEDSADSRSVLQLRGHVAFNKGKYMMNMDLIAHNEADGALSDNI